jgi:regulator of sirC expression with transglutaminase-like and TPR domain
VDLHDYARQPDDSLELLTGALLIARDAYPTLDVREYAGLIEQLAEPLRKRHLHELPLEYQAGTLAEYLYGECGFKGNQADYYDPRNSFINDVIERRLGIPITLAIVYIEVARRAGVQASGVAFPGHFLVRLDGPEPEPLIVDPFGSGQALDLDSLEHLLLRAKGRAQPFDESVIEPASVRSILVRMLLNLRAIYATRADYARLLVVLDRIIDFTPTAAREIRDRGLLWAKLGAPEAAIADLTRYIRLADSTDDVAPIKRLLEQMRGGARKDLN